MTRFLRDNWIWIALPVVLVAVGLVYVILSQDPSAVDPFVYRF